VLVFGYNNRDIDSWCTESQNPNPFVSITFNEAVLIKSFLSSGTMSGSDMYYASRFTLEFRNTLTAGFEFYTTEDGAVKV